MRERTDRPDVETGREARVSLQHSAAVAFLSSLILDKNLTDEFRTKGTAIAQSIASSSVDVILNRDLASIQADIDQYLSIDGVAYVFVTLFYVASLALAGRAWPVADGRSSYWATHSGVRACLIAAKSRCAVRNDLV